MLSKFVKGAVGASLLVGSAQGMETYQIESTKPLENGKSFVVVGDFANQWDLSRASKVFDAINHMKQNAEANAPEDFDFFITAGDNLYPFVPNKPMSFEFGRMIGLFNRDAIKDIPIYPVRGNHDCLFDDEDAELELSKRHPNWKFKEYYYQTQFEVGTNGEKMALMHVDSCYLLCATVGRAIKNGVHSKDLLDDHSQALYDSKCQGSHDYEDKGDQMLQDLAEAMDQQDQDIVWKASVMHHMMFGLHYADYGVILDKFLPLIRKYNYDIYFNGHEHQMHYAYTSPEEIDHILENYKVQPDGQFRKMPKDTCWDDVEIFPEHGPEEQSREVSLDQGERIHQLTIGASGKPTYPICQSNLDNSHGHFVYGQNKYNGFALVTVTPGQLEIQLKGVEVLASESEEQVLVEKPAEKVNQTILGKALGFVEGLLGRGKV